MKVLCVGDTFGPAGRKIILEKIPELKKNNSADLVIVNGENASAGLGINDKHAQEFIDAGVDVITGGNHSFKQRTIVPLMDKLPIIRPANYEKNTPGRGYIVVEPYLKPRVAVINLIGTIFLNGSCSPFEKVDEILKDLDPTIKHIIVDMHAETSSEKRALAWYLDGRVSAVFGTHTHVPTADEEILPKGTFYITDVGMTGPYDSVIGVKKEQAIKRFLTQVSDRFEPAGGDPRFCAVLLEIDDQSAKTLSFTRINEKVS